MLTPTAERDVDSLWTSLIIYISNCGVDTLCHPPPRSWWSASHATLHPVTTQSAKPFHRLLVHTASPTPGVYKVNKNILTIIFPLFTTLLPIKPKCLRSLWSVLERHGGPEGGKAKSGLFFTLFWIVDLWKSYLNVPDGEAYRTTTCTNSSFQKLHSLPVTHMLSSLSLWNALSLFLLLSFCLLCPSACRIVDFINADSEGPVVYLSLMAIWMQLKIVLTTRGHLYQPAFITQVSEKQKLRLINKTVKRTKATGSSLSCWPCARNVLAPTQHVIHSDFDFFLSYFIMFFFCSSSLVLYVCVS